MEQDKKRAWGEDMMSRARGGIDILIFPNKQMKIIL
jgi:hypothetical protein